MSTTHHPIRPHSEWRKSSYSNGSGGECVEAAFLPGVTAVRDSKRPGGPRLSFGGVAWSAFVGALRDDQL
ncbi:DUF397 domain-containing protein [Streptomyces sp. A3M-1-3]|uniref:DUF397 domain-containing protein n=1 Tax=Streptomyces sp. A3M-1-3 TaxID=2962044 RepID=UPI0020B83050|nr:DUF397 domain-containing protein [Streptomyces sp. A3M-1-3]MCP3819493.1 DUF397 domain-containing protein [Streptomyces sp. A3M-1-3]